MNNRETANWQKFKNDIANEDVSKEEIIEDLATAGIDIDSFLTDINQTVRQCYRQASQRNAAEGIRQKAAHLERISRSLARLSREEMIQKIIDLAESGNADALVFCREANDKTLTDEELKYLLTDIIANGGENNADK